MTRSGKIERVFVYLDGCIHRPVPLDPPLLDEYVLQSHIDGTRRKFRRAGVDERGRARFREVVAA